MRPVQDRKPRVLFLCTGNSCRSQMAEGWCQKLHGDAIEALSAGLDPQGVNPIAIEVMNEADVDISSHRSKHVNDLLGTPFDLVITVCDSAAEACPTIPGASMMHVPFDDPPRLAREATSVDETPKIYRRVRDEIRDFIRTLPTLLDCCTSKASLKT